MKKTTITFSIVLSTLCMPLSAQVKMDDVPSTVSTVLSNRAIQNGTRMPKMAKEEQLDVVTPEYAVPGIRPVEMKASSIARVAAASQLSARDTVTGYLNPEGTYFIGVSPNGKLGNPGVIGAWSQNLDCWTWRNTVTGSYKSIQYQTLYSAEFASDCDGSKYFTTSDYDFCDSVVAKGGILEGWYMMGEDGDATYQLQNGKTALGWHNGTPLQIVTRNNNKKDKFVLLENSFMPDSSKCKLAVGGLPTGKTADGLWPLTNAVSTHRSKGTHFDLIADYDTLHYVASNGSDSIVRVPHYFFGTDSFKVGTTYTHATAIRTHYDKPMRKLYVKNIAVALSADGYTALKTSPLVIGTLTATVYDKRGKVIATSTADASNTIGLSQKPGQQLIFEFKTLSNYNEILSEGFTVEDEFDVEISGITPDQKWGIFSTPSFLYQSKSKIVAADGKTYTVDYDPYIMLNGIMTTLELMGQYEEEWVQQVGIHGDTIPVAFFSAQGINYSYQCGYAYSLYQSASEFDIYSTFKPYDVETRYWNLEIHRPSYILMSADYEFNLSGDDDEPMTIWDYYRAFALNIYANARPVVGDCFSVGIAGKKLVFEIMHVDGDYTNPDKQQAQDIKNISDDSTLARKLLQNGRVVIVRGGQTFDLVGNKY